MADPFEALRAPVTPVVPDPAFSAQLRARIERAMQLPRGVTVSNLILETAPEAGAPEATRQEPAKRLSATLVPYLAVSGASRALEWYSEALGAQVRGEPYVMPDGTIGHAELEIAGGLLMLSEQSPGIGVVAPVPGEGVPVTIHLSVDDVDGVIGRAVRAGALLDRAPADYEYGRNGVFRDPFGHRWLVSAEPVRHEGPAGLREGDVAYVSLWVPDVERAASFFSNVLDWSYAAGSGPEGRQVEGLNIRHGMWGRQPRSNLFLCFAVSDVHSAAERVRSAGGTAEEPHREPYGMISECVDDQGVAFALFEAPGGAGTDMASGATNGARQGDVAYLTIEVVDSAKARAFYGTVLGWRFSPGHIEDGWQVQDTVPMIGMSGGHAEATTLPMYRVDDIEVAVGRVRTSGGTSQDIEVHPYGTTSTCTDDQGTRFYLGQL